MALERLTREFVWKRPLHELPQLVITDKVVLNKASAAFQEVFISSVEPQEIGIGRLQMNSVILIYDPMQWKLEIEHLLVDSHYKSGMPFYRIMLDHTHMEQEMTVEFRFEIRED